MAAAKLGLDLFCKAGGASAGYERAGIMMVGVDIEPQPHYRGEFHQADALTFLAEFGGYFDFVHASPPCPGYSMLRNQHHNTHPLLIEPTRTALRALGKPYVIENVVGAPLVNPIRLCGEMFALGVIRHRLFESNTALTAPAHITHRGRVRGWRHGIYHDGPYVAPYGEGGGKGSTEEWANAMGIDWMTRDELRDAIPPAYTEHIGHQL
jgi:hypothetical protein